MPPVENLTTEEQEYFDSRGESDIPEVKDEGGADSDESTEAEAKPDGEGVKEDAEESTELEVKAEEEITESKEAEPEPESIKEEKRTPSTVPYERFSFQAKELQLEKKAREEADRTLDRLLKAAEKPPPDPDEDPDAFQEHQQNKLLAEVEELKQFKQDTETDNAQEQIDSDLKAEFVASASVLSKKNPDFAPQYAAMIGARANQLKLQGMDNIGQIKTQIQKEELALVQHAKEQGVDVAEFILDWSRTFAPIKTKAAENGDTKETKSEETTDVEQKLDTIEKAQKQDSKMSGSGEGTENLTKERLVAMSDVEFNKWADKNPEFMDTIRRLK